MKKGKLIVFEGADGSGKTTQSKLILKYLKGRKIACEYVSFPRYEGSNIGHMGAKLKTQNSKLKYIKWLEQLEYVENGIPKEDLVIFLYVPIAVSKNLMKGRTLDIHERDF